VYDFKVTGESIGFSLDALEGRDGVSHGVVLSLISTVSPLLSMYLCVECREVTKGVVCGEGGNSVDETR